MAVDGTVINHAGGKTRSRSFLRYAIILLPVGFLFLSLLLGRYHIPPYMVLKILLSKIFPIVQDWSPVVETVLYRVRIPRIAAAMLIGGALSVSGATFQGIFRNPLISPYILGVASGAGFGASLAILFSENGMVIQLLAFAFGTVAVMISYTLARLYKVSSSLVLVLSGIIVGTFFTALISMVKFWADPFEKLPLIVFWLMGSLATITSRDTVLLMVPMIIGLSVLFLVRWKINVLALGEEEARALGIETGRLRIITVLAATLCTASAVAVSGIIGWVGLVIPHLARMITGPDYRKLIPVSFSLGASYLLLIDDVARNITASEIPIGILTATIGAPVFALVLKKSALGWS